ncbi:MAG: hypothetical protein ACQR33_01650 [Candidatus Saccharibacteria bacterium]
MATPKETSTTKKPRKKATTPKTSATPKPKEAQPVVSPQKERTDETRVVKGARYKSFSLQKRITQVGPALPSAWKIFRQSVGILKRNWKPFLGIVVVYGAVNMVLVQSLSSGAAGSVTSAKGAFEGMFNGGIGHVAAGAASFVYLLGLSGNSAGSTAGSYQLVWILMISLALIWTLRQVYASQKVRIRDGFYKGMYPLVPFVCVLMIIALQVLPMIVASSLFSSVVSNGTAATFTEMAVWILLFASLSLVSLYMVSSSLFGLYIVSLPDMTPLNSLRSARALVANRRWTVMRKILFLPVLLFVLGALIMIPLIIAIPSVAYWLLFGLLMVCVPLMHSYLYTLYRALL